ARDLLRFYASGVGTVIHWEFQDQSWGQSSFGLLDEKANARPIYRMLRMISTTLALDRPECIERITGEGLFTTRGRGRELLWGANLSHDIRQIVFTDGTRRLGPPAQALPPCRTKQGNEGFSIPALTLATTPIARP